MKPESITIKNLESAFAGESMAHTKYRYFAKIARAQGDEATAKVFEDTATQEVEHAFGHLDLLYPRQNSRQQRHSNWRSRVKPTNTPRCIQTSGTWPSRKATPPQLRN